MRQFKDHKHFPDIVHKNPSHGRTPKLNIFSITLRQKNTSISPKWAISRREWSLHNHFCNSAIIILVFVWKPCLEIQKGTREARWQDKIPKTKLMSVRGSNWDLYTLRNIRISLFAHRSRGCSRLLGIFFYTIWGSSVKNLEPEASTFQWFRWPVVAEVLYMHGAFKFDPKKKWCRISDPMESPFVLDGTSNVPPPTCPQSNVQKKEKGKENNRWGFILIMRMTKDVTFSSEFLKIFSDLVNVVIDLLPLQTCPRCCCWFLVAGDLSVWPELCVRKRTRRGG